MNEREAEATDEPKLSEAPIKEYPYSGRERRGLRRAGERSQYNTVGIRDAADQVQAELGHKMNARQIAALRHIETEQAKK